MTHQLKLSNNIHNYFLNKIVSKIKITEHDLPPHSKLTLQHVLHTQSWHSSNNIDSTMEPTVSCKRPV